MVDFFRCIECGGVVNDWDVADGKCPKCGGHKIKYTNLSFFEEIVQLVKHPSLIKEVWAHFKSLLRRES